MVLELMVNSNVLVSLYAEKEDICRNKRSKAT